jgi:hypothetical protein
MTNHDRRHPVQLTWGTYLQCSMSAVRRNGETDHVYLVPALMFVSWLSASGALVVAPCAEAALCDGET